MTKPILHSLHWHHCYSCQDMLVCGCSDKRQHDRENGKERQIYCFPCAELNKSLTMAFINQRVTLERVN